MTTIVQVSPTARHEAQDSTGPGQSPPEEATKLEKRVYLTSFSAAPTAFSAST